MKAKNLNQFDHRFPKSFPKFLQKHVCEDNVYSSTINFLQKVLKPFEADRICWDEVFKHDIFEGYFDSYLAENKEFENKYKKVMGDLRFKVNSENIDIKLLWKNLGFDEDK